MTFVPARIACVYRFDDANFVYASMDRIRFLRMAQALARAGHTVDLIVRRGPIVELGPRLRKVPVRYVRWNRYDVVKASLHLGFDEVVRRGGQEHPFILASLGSVVGEGPRPGVHFFGEFQDSLLETQREIGRRARAVTLLTDENEALWLETHGPDMLRLRVPTGVDATLPDPIGDPYRKLGFAGRAVLFAGNIYGNRQREVNLLWSDRLNRLGRALDRRGLRLVAMGTGTLDAIDPQVVTHVGPVDIDDLWDWQRHAEAGVVVAHGAVQDNESSKIYYYLRTELPVVCEEPVPNRWLIEKTGLGAVVPLDDVDAMADAAASFAGRRRTDNGVAEWMATEHSWDERAGRYASLFEEAVAIRPRARRQRSRTRATNIVLLSPGMAEKQVWGERVVLRALARALPAAFPRARVELLDPAQLELIDDRRVDLLISLCTGPRPPWRADDVAERIDGISLLWVLNHPDLLDEFAAIPVDGFLSNSRRATEVLGATRSATWCPLGVAPGFARLPGQARYAADVTFLGSGGIGNKNPQTTHHFLDPAKRFDFGLWGSNWSRDYWAPVHAADPERNDWHRFWRGPLPVGEEAALYSSAGVVLGFHEDGQREWGMWNNRVFEALASASLFISDAADGLVDEFGDALVVTSGGEETAALIERYLGDEAECVRRGELGRRLVMERYTYEHAAQRIRDAYLQAWDARGIQPALTASAS